MKKILLTMALAVAMLPSMAKDYTDNLVVSINSVETPAQTTTITVDKRADGAYDFSLKDFRFQGIYVGDINLDSVPGVQQDGIVYLSCTDKVHVSLNRVFPMDLDVTLRGELFDNENKLYASMDIPVTGLGQDVNVLFGNAGYQLPNSGFEDFHDETLYDLDFTTGQWTSDVASRASVPNAWHSFMDATGWTTLDDGTYTNSPMIVYLASGMVAPHTFVSTEVRPGSIGTHSVKVIARNAYIAIANGTITTGRMNTGSTTATDVANHAWLDMDSTGTDANGDPFYTVMNGRPDSLTVWVKYGQGTANAEHPYATVSAAITDGTYYQEPDTNVYNNVYAIARNNKIASTNGQWQRLAIPFEVQNANVNGKAIMVTISTNADAGQGSDGDSILVDDINFVYNDPQNVNITYNDNANALTVSPNDINVTWDGALDARVVKSLKQEGDDVVATVTVYNGDLTKQIKKDTHTFRNATVDGISNITIDDNTSLQNAEVFDLSGRRVNSTVHGNVYILKTADGKTVKVIK